MEPSPILDVQQPVSHPRRRIIVVGTVLAVLILALLAGWWAFTVLNNQALFPKEQHSQISLGVGPVGSWFMIDSKQRTLELATLLDEQTSLYVIDYVVVGDTTYALITDGTMSSLVSQTTEGVRTTLSGNDTFKFGLSYDEVSDTFVYAAVPTSKDVLSIPSVTIFNPRVGSEQVVAKGYGAVLLSGGLAVLFQADNQLHIVSAGGVELAQLTAANGLPFAVSENRERVALYNPTTKSVDEYSLLNSTFSYVDSYASLHEPQALVYNGSQIIGFAQANSSLLAFGVGNRATLQEVYKSPIPQALPRDIMSKDN